MDRDEILPFAPFERYLYTRYGPDPKLDSVTLGTERLLTDNRVAALTGRSRNVVFTWRHKGMAWWVADRACIALGVHVSEIWPAEHAACA